MSNQTIPFEKTIPGVYEKYLGPYLYEPYAVYTTSRIKGKPEEILEIGIGSGRLTNHLSKNFINSKITGVDINPNMLDIALEKVKGTNVELHVADAQSLPFQDNCFDCVVCQFGFMFLPDKQKGFDEAWRVLKPGGQFLFVTWDKAENNITLNISQQTILQNLKEEPPAYFGKAYSAMHNPDDLMSFCKKAGFDNPKIEKVTLKGESPSAMDAAIGFVEGNSIVKEILKEGPKLLQSIKAIIVSRINEQVCKDPICSELNAWIGEAFK